MVGNAEAGGGGVGWAVAVAAAGGGGAVGLCLRGSAAPAAAPSPSSSSATVARITSRDGDFGSWLIGHLRARANARWNDVDQTWLISLYQNLRAEARANHRDALSQSRPGHQSTISR